MPRIPVAGGDSDDEGTGPLHLDDQPAMTAATTHSDRLRQAAHATAAQLREEQAKLDQELRRIRRKAAFPRLRQRTSR